MGARASGIELPHGNGPSLPRKEGCVLGSPLSHFSEHDGNRFLTSCAFFGMRVFFHFDNEPLCCFFRRSKGGRAPPSEEFLRLR